MTDENDTPIEDMHPKFTLVEKPVEEDVEPEEEDLDEIPTVATQAVKVIYPMFVDPDSGRPLPPPPGHDFRLGIQVSITTEGRVLQESPGIFFISGNDIEEIADSARNIILQGLEQIKKAASPIITPDQMSASSLETLKKFGVNTLDK